MCLITASMEITWVRQRLVISPSKKVRLQFIHWLEPVVFLEIFYKNNESHFNECNTKYQIISLIHKFTSTCFFHFYIIIPLVSLPFTLQFCNYSLFKNVFLETETLTRYIPISQFTVQNTIFIISEKYYLY
jgi:hypothetical protein